MARSARERATAGATVFLVVTLVAVAGAAAVYTVLVANDATSTSTQVSTTFLPTSSTIVNGTSSSEPPPQGNSSNPLQIPSSYSSATSSAGIELSLGLSGFSNGTLLINATEYDTLGAIVNVSAANGWSYSEAAMQSYSGACLDKMLPMGVVIIKGFYVSNSFQTQEALTLYNAVAGTSCQGGVPSPSSYGFSGESDYAAVYGAQGLEGQGRMQLFAWTSGYWAGNGASQPVFTHFPLGNYTVVAGDEWGQVVVLHFGVVTTRPDSPRADAGPAAATAFGKKGES